MLTIDWNFNRICNFNCEYCINDPKDKSALGPKFDEVKKAISRFKNQCLWALSGGELFLNTDFVKICKFLTEQHCITLYTNLTISVDDFIKNVSVDRVKFIMAALHIKERDRLHFKREQIVTQINKLKDAGFYVMLVQVCDDYALLQYDELFEWFLSKNIYLIPLLIKNSLWHKFNYTDEQLLKIQHYLELCKEHGYNKFSLEYNRTTCRKGQVCVAGYKYMIVLNDGTVRECWGSHRYLGNIFVQNLTVESQLSNKAIICPYDICPCFPSNLYEIEI